MKINKSVSIDVKAFDNIRSFMVRTNTKKFSNALSILVNLGYAQWEKQFEK